MPNLQLEEKYLAEYYPVTVYSLTVKQNTA